VSTEKAKKVEKPFLHTLLYAPPPVLLELVNAVADDLATWSRLGLFGKRFGEKAGRFSDWCWFLTTLVGLVENGVERQMNGSLQAEGAHPFYQWLPQRFRHPDLIPTSRRAPLHRVNDRRDGQVQA